MNTELRPGYKLTEVGVIPEDWEAAKLKGCCNKITDGTHDTPKTVRSGVPFLTAIHVKDNLIDYQSCLYVTQVDHAIIYSRCNPEKNDVLMVNIGAGVATTALINVEYPFSLKNVALLKPDSRRAVGSYLNYTLAQRKPKITKDLSNGGAQPFLSLKQIGEIVVPLPPTKAEQEAIAEALSDADALIESLEQLITKKRHLKQGAMQELLTGKKRLPGFSGEWEVKRLREECEFITKGTTPTSIGKNFTNIGINFIKIESLEDNGKVIKDKIAFIDEETNKLLKRSQLQEKDILVSIAGALGRVAVVTADLLPANTNQALAIVRLKTSGKIYYRFLFYYLNSLSIKKYIEAINVQAAQANLSLENVGDFVIAFPLISEQTAIATILSDMDAEIAALETKLAKTRSLKQGMMHELLTGKTRLL